MGDYSFGREKRLRGRNAVSRLFTGGQGGFVYPFRYVLETGESAAPGVAVLVSVPKKHHKRANKRNMLKRRTREAWRLQCPELDRAAREKGVKVNIALIWVSPDMIEYKTIADAVGKILTQVGQRL